MTAGMSERWERISSLFAAARALDAHARDSFLTLACEDDEELRAQVEALLASDSPDDGFLENPPWIHLAQSVVAELTNARNLTSGQVLNDRYCIEKELATGGQAQVYLAHDQNLLMRPVVIKVMRAEGRRSRWLKVHFEREMQALARIDHPGVVGILDVGELEDGSPFLVIQHVPGISLRELLAQGPIPPSRAAAILREMGSALRAAHAAGIAHRDLKPENVMLQQRNDGADIVRLIDFGIAQFETAGLEPGPTVVQLTGTVRYMPPEQFEGRHSSASDVYAMALVACEMLGGYPHIGALPAATSRETRAALESALAFRPAERPSDVQAWSEGLARTLVPGRRRVRPIAVGIALMAITLAAAAAIGRNILLDAGEPPRIVEKVGAFDPLAEGFEAREDITWSGVADNPTRTGYDAWRVETGSRGLYLHPFTGSQARLALARGWKLKAVLKAEEGASYVAAHFHGVDRGFPIQVLQEGDHEIVRLPSRAVPDLRGMDYVQAPPGEYHEYMLVYDPILKTADLWIDGEQRLAGYPGWTQDPYHLGLGFHFGTAVYKSERGVSSFRSVRFEIDP